MNDKIDKVTKKVTHVLESIVWGKDGKVPLSEVEEEFHKGWQQDNDNN